jgi:hypothetical protein
MLGWHASAYRQTDGGYSPANFESPTGARVAVWQTGLGGLEWLKELAKQGNAIDLGENGYPCRFTAQAQHVAEYILSESLQANENWLVPEGSVIASPDVYVGKTQIDRGQIQQCRTDEWLLIQAWDES